MMIDFIYACIYIACGHLMDIENTVCRPGKTTCPELCCLCIEGGAKLSSRLTVEQIRTEDLAVDPGNSETDCGS